MFNWIPRLGACLLIVGLAACSTPEVPFDRVTNSDIKTIGVFDPAMPTNADIVLASTVGQSFGLVGALVDAGMENNRENKFNAMLRAHNSDPHDTLIANIKATLKDRGFDPVFVPVDRPNLGLLKSYQPFSGVHADALLDISVVQYGYVAAGIGDSTPYRPFVALHCRLVRTSNGAVLMDDTVAYNPVGNPRDVITLSPDPNYVFIDFDTLMGSPDRAIDGLNKALGDSSAAIGRVLQ